MTRCRSNHQPYPIYTTVLTGKNLPPHVGYRLKIPRPVLNMLANQPKDEIPSRKQKLIQTMFRDSEAQTDPYVVDLVESTDKGLEILTLEWLSWNNGLPAGMNEIQTIERARQKRAWEAALPLAFDNVTKEMRAAIIKAMEINEWNYREDLIAAIGSLRVELAEKQMKDKCREDKAKYEERLSKYVQVKKDEKNKKIEKLRLSFSRQTRKLVFSRQKINQKYQRWNVIKQFTDKTSELYAPPMRFGENPRHWHEKIRGECKYWGAFRKLEIMHHTMADISELAKPAFDYVRNAKPKNREKELCIRATKWTEENLEKLHEQLRNIRRRRHVAPRPRYLKKKVPPPSVEAPTPEVEGIPAEEEDLFQVCLFLQKTIKGRAIQAVMFEGRVKCQELIEELKSTHALQNHMEDVKAEMRKRVYGLQRQAEINQNRERRKKEILNTLEGKTTGDMLDFLAKELLRLQDERKTHALALLADQERHKREAAEAGRRQVEEQRRREHDEMFKQIVKMHQNTVHAFVENAMARNREWLAHREAREHVSKMAQKIDQVALERTGVSTLANFEDLMKHEEIIADLIHNFALPEAEKRIVRKRLNDRQRNYLKICHDEVYSNIEKVVQGVRTDSGQLLPLRIIGKHKIPPFVRVKYLRLKRMHESSSSTSGSQNSRPSMMNDQGHQMHSLKQNLSEQQQEYPEPIDQQIWSSGFSREEVILEHD